MPGIPLPAQRFAWTPPTDFPVVTTPYVPGSRVTKVIGLRFGPILRSRGLGRNTVVGFRALGGGEITEYTQLVDQARHEALVRWQEHAKSLGANAVISAGFDTSEMSEILTEIMAFLRQWSSNPTPPSSSPSRSGEPLPDERLKEASRYGAVALP